MISIYLKDDLNKVKNSELTPDVQSIICNMDCKMILNFNKTTTGGIFFLIFMCLCCNLFAAPPGYDENTEIVVTGLIKNASAGSYGGLECFTLESRSRVFTVITGPRWFVRQRGLLLKQGVEMQVVGSKFYGLDGRLYLVARFLKPVIAGHRVMLRDKTCKPLWRDSGVKGSSCMHINYHSKQSLIF